MGRLAVVVLVSEDLQNTKGSSSGRQQGPEPQCHSSLGRLGGEHAWSQHCLQELGVWCLGDEGEVMASGGSRRTPKAHCSSPELLVGSSSGSRASQLQSISGHCTTSWLWQAHPVLVSPHCCLLSPAPGSVCLMVPQGWPNRFYDFFGVYFSVYT